MLNYIKGILLNILVGIVLLIHLYTMADNANYISLSSKIARNRELSIVTNNVANVSTIGYKQDALILHKIDKSVTKKRNNSFVKAHATFMPNEEGNLKITNRNLDLAIIGNGYFKVLTNIGPRYTLNGMTFISNNGDLINQEGWPLLSIDDQVINIPIDASDIHINKDGVIYVNKEEIAQVGVFEFENNINLIKEGSGLYNSTIEANLSQNYSILSGALRGSNVDNVKVMSSLIESQRASDITNNLISNLNELEKNAIYKLIKNN